MGEMPLIADTYPFMMDTVALLFIVPTRLHIFVYSANRTYMHRRDTLQR